MTVAGAGGVVLGSSLKLLRSDLLLGVGRGSRVQFSGFSVWYVYRTVKVSLMEANWS